MSRNSGPQPLNKRRFVSTVVSGVLVKSMVLPYFGSIVVQFTLKTPFSAIFSISEKEASVFLLFFHINNNNPGTNQNK